MQEVLLTGSVAFLITFLAIPVIIRVADEKGLFDLPDARKIHTRPIASLGGVGIFIGFLLSLLLSVSGKFNPEFQYLFAAIIVTFFLGLKDDILIISASKKFLGQLAAAGIIIHLGGIRIESMHELLGIGQLPDPVGLLLSYITIVFIINAYNLIDGVDGLAGSLGLMTMVIFGLYFLAAGMTGYALLAFAVGGSLLAFLIYNFHPAKIFMGDSGSLMLGLVNAILVLKFISVADHPSSALAIESSVAVGVAVLSLPLLDTLRVFSIRIFRGRSPFSPDRNHIHHLLVDRGLDHRQVSVTCVALNLAFVAAAYFGRSLGPTILLGGMFVTACVLLALLYYGVRPSARVVMARTLHTAGPTVSGAPSKVVSIKNEAAVAE